MRILIIYASKTGSTKYCAKRIKSKLEEYEIDLISSNEIKEI